ncbi:Mediator of RNA polymerase II transcription subunit 4 [Pseudocercospora fuligena]|uniref:Mediator of RNA polymerase II transcription subunit 4 n=1 Tax=Pseudocercospora fuligena TaxID=685502 RepID=A0A8H6VGI1_9PEZI|nr:Mediator of RNA polymerase II transcription subunit 4 [Pseudocercospora fuligena]
MFAQFQASYARVETSLQKLTDSIAAYNPSVRDAQELLAADEAVNQNIEQLVTHQQNHQRLVSLRATADSLDATIKNTIRLLADTRREIQSIPSVDSEDRREVGVEELLQYAKFIAPTTVAPTFRKPLPDEQMPKKKKEAATEVGANGIATPVDTNPAYTKSGEEKKEAEPAAPPPPAYDFVPWPDHGKITAGALGDIQRMLDAGQDPAAVLSAEEQAEVDRKRKEQEAEERKKAEELERQQRDAFGDYSSGRRGTVVFNPDDL